MLLWAFAAAICALYTPLAFRLLELDSFALDVAVGRIPISDLTRYERYGLVFSQSEIRHFADIALVVAATRTALVMLLAANLALVLFRPRLRHSVTTMALVIFLSAGAVLCVVFALAGYDATSDILHGFAFAPGSHIFETGSLTGYLYGRGDMIAGACFVLGLTTLTLGLAWCAARIPLPRYALQDCPPSQTSHKRNKLP